MTFTDYITNRARVTDTPQGDFVADTRRLIRAGMFKEPASGADLVSRVPAHAQRAARLVWKNYRICTKETAAS